MANAILETRVVVRFSSVAGTKTTQMSSGMRACTGGRAEEEEEEGPWAAFNANRLGKQSIEGWGGEAGKRGPVRHVKLTNRSGLAGFRIPRVIGRDPVAPSGTVVSPRPTYLSSFRERGNTAKVR